MLNATFVPTIIMRTMKIFWYILLYIITIEEANQSKCVILGIMLVLGWHCLLSHTWKPQFPIRPQQWRAEDPGHALGWWDHRSCSPSIVRSPWGSDRSPPAPDPWAHDRSSSPKWPKWRKVARPCPQSVYKAHSGFTVTVVHRHHSAGGGDGR